MSEINMLQVFNLTKKFIYQETKLEILKNINFIFEQSKSYSITGVSGSGKSTLIHLLSGTDLPTSGNIFFNGKDINKFTQDQKANFLNKEIGLVFQEPYLIKELTVLENIIIKGLIDGSNINDCKNEGMTLLQKIGLEKKANQFPTTLSVGQQQRVAILRAIFNKPEFLLADEPTANLDENSRMNILNLFKSFQEDFGSGIIIVTHDKYIIDNSQFKLHLENGSLFLN